MIPLRINYDYTSGVFIVTGGIIKHNMPDVAAVVTTGLGVSVLAGVLSGVCYILVNGFGSRRSRRRENRWYCQICGVRLNSTKQILDDCIVTCLKCGSRVCKEKCARYIQRGDWICQNCLLPEQSWLQGIAQTIRSSTHYFGDPFETIMDDARASSNFDSLREMEKEEVRDFIEKLVNVMLGENVDSASISMLYNDKQYLPALGQSPCTAHAALKEIIEKLSKQAVNLPMLEKAHAQEANTEEDNKNKTYEDLLATAIINKVVDSCQNNLPGSSANSVSSRLSASSRYKDDKEYFFSEETLYNKWKTTDLDSTSVSSLDEWGHSESSFGSRKYAEKVTLMINQNIEEVDHLDTDPENEDDNNLKNDAEYFRSTSSLFSDSESNWRLQRRSYRGSPSPVPVPMLVPNPTNEAKVLIGDKPLDDTSDLSDIGSDFEDMCPTQTTYSLLVQSKNIIGGGSSQLQLLENGDEHSESSTDSGVKEVNGQEEKRVDSMKSHKTDITVDDDNVEDSSYISVCSNTEKVAEYTEKYASLPRQILKQTNVTASIKENLRNSCEDVSKYEQEAQNHSYSDNEFVGNYSKKEKEKWNHAVEMKNNPYSKENIEKRLHRSRSSASSLNSSDCMKLARLPSGGSERVARISSNWPPSDSTRENSPSPPLVDFSQNQSHLSGERYHYQIDGAVQRVETNDLSVTPPIYSTSPSLEFLKNERLVSGQPISGEFKREVSVTLRKESSASTPISSTLSSLDLLKNQSYLSRQSFFDEINGGIPASGEKELSIPPPISSSPPSLEFLKDQSYISGQSAHGGINREVTVAVRKESSVPPPIYSTPPSLDLLKKQSYISGQTIHCENNRESSVVIKKESSVPPPIPSTPPSLDLLKNQSYISGQSIQGEISRESSVAIKRDSSVPPPIVSTPPSLDLFKRQSYISEQSINGEINGEVSVAVRKESSLPPSITSTPPSLDILKNQSNIAGQSVHGEINGEVSVAVRKESSFPPPISSTPPSLDIFKTQSYISGQSIHGESNREASVDVRKGSSVPPPISSTPPSLDIFKKLSSISGKSFYSETNTEASAVVEKNTSVPPPISSTPPSLDLLQNRSYISEQSFNGEITRAEPAVVIPETNKMFTISSHSSVSSPIRSKVHQFALDSYSPEMTSDSDLSYVNSYDVEHSQVIKETKNGSLHIPIKSAPVGLSYKSYSNEINNNKEADNYVVITHTTEERMQPPKPIARARSFKNISKTEDDIDKQSSSHVISEKKMVRQTSETNLLDDSFDAPPKILSQKRDNTIISKIYKDPKVRLFAMKSRDDSVGEPIRYQTQRSLELIDSSHKNDSYHHTRDRAYQSSEGGLSSEYESGKTGKMSFFSSDEDLLSDYSDVSLVNNNVVSNVNESARVDGQMEHEKYYYIKQSAQSTPKPVSTRKFIYSSQENLLAIDENNSRYDATLPKKKDNTLITKIYSDPRVLDFALKTHGDNMPMEAITPTPTPKPNFSSTDDTYFFPQNIQPKTSNTQKLYKSYDDLSSDNISFESSIQKETQLSKVQDGYNSEDIDIDEISKKRLVRNALGRFSKSEVHLKTSMERRQTEESMTQEDEIRVSVRDLRKKFENNDKRSHQVVSSLTARSLSKKVKDILKL
ncbi:uncharacterized protein LOC143192981 isoform X3 [Rhynchophorus ferrugineus]|uniref:uncharacterized protein LOC143192981 isoform X3 n=1 Tax=Rhynchophorus ferrugineus TaxID=354439 RepID=UPI003FCD3072